MNSDSKELSNISNSLNEIKRLLQQQIAIQLYTNGVSQNEIGKNMKIATGTVNHMLKGMKKEKAK